MSADKPQLPTNEMSASTEAKVGGSDDKEAVGAQQKETIGRDDKRESVTSDLQKTDAIDTLHNDEALKVLAQYSGDEHWQPSEEKKLVRKIDRRLLSILCITYGLQYYDKAMLSQAVSKRD